MDTRNYVSEFRIHLLRELPSEHVQVFVQTILLLHLEALHHVVMGAQPVYQLRVGAGRAIRLLLHTEILTEQLEQVVDYGSSEAYACTLFAKFAIPLKWNP